MAVIAGEQAARPPARRAAPAPAVTQDPYAAAVARQAPYFQNWVNTDPVYQSQVQGLIGQLQNAYTGDTTPVLQSYLDYGGPLDAQSTQAALSRYGAPTLPWDAGQALGPGQRSIAQMLMDPSLQQTAAANPFSTTNVIARQLTQGNQNAANNLAGRGLAYSGAQQAAALGNDYMAGQARAKALSDFLGGVNTAYGNYTNAAQTAYNTRTGYQTDALNRAIALIKAGAIGAPTKKVAAPSAPKNYVSVTGAQGVLGLPGRASSGVPSVSALGSPDVPRYPHIAARTQSLTNFPSDAASRAGMVRPYTPSPMAMAGTSYRNTIGPS